MGNVYCHYDSKIEDVDPWLSNYSRVWCFDYKHCFLSLDYVFQVEQYPILVAHQDAFVLNSGIPGAVVYWKRDYLTEGDVYAMLAAKVQGLPPSVAVPGGHALYDSDRAATFFLISSTNEIYCYVGNVLSMLREATEMIENEEAFIWVQGTMQTAVLEVQKSSKLVMIPLVKETPCSHKLIKLSRQNFESFVIHFENDGYARISNDREVTGRHEITCCETSFCGYLFEAPVSTDIAPSESKYLRIVDTMLMFRYGENLYRLHASFSKHTILGFDPVQTTLIFTDGGLVHIGYKHVFKLLEFVEDDFWPAVPTVATQTVSLIVLMNPLDLGVPCASTLVFYDRVCHRTIEVKKGDPTKMRLTVDSPGKYKCTDVWGRLLDNQEMSFTRVSSVHRPVFMINGRCAVVRCTAQSQTYIDPSLSSVMHDVYYGTHNVTMRDVPYVNEHPCMPPRPQTAPIFVGGVPGDWFVVRAMDDHGCTTARESPDTAELEASLTITPSTAGQVVILSSNVLQRTMLVTRLGCTAPMRCYDANMLLQNGFDIVEDSVLVSKSNTHLRVSIYKNSGCAALVSLVYDCKECPTQ